MSAVGDGAVTDGAEVPGSLVGDVVGAAVGVYVGILIGSAVGISVAGLLVGELVCPEDEGLPLRGELEGPNEVKVLEGTAVEGAAGFPVGE